MPSFQPRISQNRADYAQFVTFEPIRSDKLTFPAQKQSRSNHKYYSQLLSCEANVQGGADEPDKKVASG